MRHPIESLIAYYLRDKVLFNKRWIRVAQIACDKCCSVKRRQHLSLNRQFALALEASLASRTNNLSSSRQFSTNSAPLQAAQKRKSTNIFNNTDSLYLLFRAMKYFFPGWITAISLRNHQERFQFKSVIIGAKLFPQ